MPAKRKLASRDEVEPSAKRRTRSSGPIVCDPAQTLQRVKVQATKPKGLVGTTDGQAPFKGHCVGDSAAPSDDELNLSPSKSTSRPPRTFLHSVEIPCPRRFGSGSTSHTPHTRIMPVDHIDPVFPLKRSKLTTYKSRNKKRTKSPKVQVESSDSSPESSPDSLSETSSEETNLTTPTTSPSRRSKVLTSKTALVPVTNVSPTKISTAFNPVPSSKHPAAVVVPVIPPSKKNAYPARAAFSKASPRADVSKMSTLRASPIHIPHKLPSHLHSCLNNQKHAILRALRSPLELDNAGWQSEGGDDDTLPTNDIAFEELCDLLNGTVTRGEGNSCLLLGPRGSGKTRVVERSLALLSDRPIVLRLSGWVQHNDRLAMREIARQLTQQTGASFLSDVHDNDDDDEADSLVDVEATTSLPPPSHLPALISVLPTLSRPTIVILDRFDLFAYHARQSLLYCLLDTVQSCRAGQGNKGVAVIGVTTRVDTINLLEKRVKSRFSGRMLRTAPLKNLEDWMKISKNVLCAPVVTDTHDPLEMEWAELWQAATDKFFEDQKVVNTLGDTFDLTKDVRMLSRILTCVATGITTSSPFPSSTLLVAATVSQRNRSRFPALHTLPYPSICLLIAAMHAETAGHDDITFEMLYEYFHNQVRTSSAAPVQIEGGSIGILRCTRDVLMSAFEQLISAKLFVAIGPSSTTVAKEFVKYRCLAGRLDVKNVVDKRGQTSLKKWFRKAQ